MRRESALDPRKFVLVNSLPSDSSTSLTPAAKKYLIVDQGLIAIGANFLINYLIAWSTHRDVPIVPIEGKLSLLEDVTATSFLMPFIACLVVSHLTRFELQKGRFPPLPPFRWMSFLGDYFTSSYYPRAVIFAVIGGLVVAPLAAMAIRSSGLQPLPLSQFLLLKGAIGSVYGIVLCPLFAWLAMHTPETYERGHR